MITHSSVQSSTWTFIHITSNDHSFSCPIIYMGTIHMTSNDRSFSCPIIYMNTIHMTSNDRSFSCPIIYTDTIHITSNDNSFSCPIIYIDTIHIISYDHSFKCPIIYTDCHLYCFHTRYPSTFTDQVVIPSAQMIRYQLYRWKWIICAIMKDLLGHCPEIKSLIEKVIFVGRLSKWIPKCCRFNIFTEMPRYGDD